MRQAAFLGALAETGSVSEAARRVGMARETAYRLRARPDGQSFAAAWDAALGRESSGGRKVTAEERARRATTGLLQLHFYRGRHVATRRKPDNSALRGHLAQLDRALARFEAQGGRSHCFDEV